MGLSSEILDICIPSGIFCYRNIKKATDDSENGEKSRSTVAFAQGAKLVEAVTKYNDETAKTAKSALSVFDKYAKQYKAVDYAGKAVNWATHNVNPLICISGGIKTLTSDDKVHTGITQLGALSGMFLGEGLIKLYQNQIFNEKNVSDIVKRFQNTRGLKTVCEKLLKSGNCGKAASILKGLAFVTGSITSYSIGEKIGNNTADRICADAGIEVKKKIDRKV